MVRDDYDVRLPGAPVFIDSLVTYMSPDGETVEALILVEVEGESGTIAEVYLHPLAPLAPRTPYTLVTIDRENGRQRLAEAAEGQFVGRHPFPGPGLAIRIIGEKVVPALCG